MSEVLPDPLVPAEVDLKDFPFTPIFRARLFGSRFHAEASDAEWRAGVTLWLKSWDQTPAGTLPPNDIELARLAEFGRDLKAWKKVRVGALHGWFLCIDERLHHRVVADGVMEAWTKKAEHRDRMKRAREVKKERRASSAASSQEPITEPATGSITGSIIEPITEPIKEPITGSLTGLKGEGQYKGQGQLSKKDSDPSGSDGKPSLDPAKVLFDFGVAVLTEAGASEKQARSLIGRWRSQIGDDPKLTSMLMSAKNGSVVSPVEYLTRAVANELHRRRNGSGYIPMHPGAGG